MSYSEARKKRAQLIEKTKPNLKNVKIEKIDDSKNEKQTKNLLNSLEISTTEVIPSLAKLGGKSKLQNTKDASKLPLNTIEEPKVIEKVDLKDNTKLVDKKTVGVKSEDKRNKTLPNNKKEESNQNPKVQRIEI